MLTKVSAGVLNIDDLYGFRNRIINGDMRIDQRNAGASITLSGTIYTIDRWITNIASSFNGVSTGQQNLNGLTPPSGFTNYFGFVVNTGTPVTGDAFFNVRQIIEGLNIDDLNWGTASAKSITLSFWVQASITGTYTAALRNNAVNRSYVATYTILSANTWEYKTITIPGDTSGTWLTTNGVGITLSYGLANITGMFSTSSPNEWLNGNKTGLTTAVELLSTTGATFYITGVQLEKGTVATPFERRPYGTELALCQRYYFKWVPVELGNDYAVSFNPSTTTARGTVPFPVSMRTGPSALEQSGTATDYSVRHGASVTNCSSVPTYAGGTTLNAGVLFTVASGLTAGQGSQLRNNNGTAGYLAWSAEL